MGDIRVLDPRMDPRFDAKQSRPWPPMYRSHPGPSFCYRPVPLDAMGPQWIPPHVADYNYVPARMSAANSSKGRDYYYLAPLYRNAIPPPQPMSPLQLPSVAVSPRMMMMDARGRTRSNAAAACTCSMGRTRSLEDVRSEASEWEDCQDENGNHLQRKSPKGGGAAMCRQGRRSMENLLDVETANGELNTFDSRVAGRGCRRLDEGRNERPGRRRGSYMVCWLDRFYGVDYIGCIKSCTRCQVGSSRGISFTLLLNVIFDRPLRDFVYFKVVSL